MDAERFDSLLRTISHSPSRRSALRLLAGSALGGALGWLGDEEAAAGRKKRKKRKKKKRGCPEDSFECPDGTCVPSRSSPGSRNCCHGEPCGDCGVCVNGRCAEVPGICDSACERCSQVHWSCESTCDAGESCVGGQCCNSGRTCFGVCCPEGEICGDDQSCEDPTKCPRAYCSNRNLGCCPPNSHTAWAYCRPANCTCADTLLGYTC